MLDVRPALPPVIKGKISTSAVDNVVALLGHHNCVCQIDLKITISGAMKVSFLELTDL
jgi:hypothetical protein